MADSREIKGFPSNEIECIVGEDGDLGGGSYGYVRLGFHPIHGVIAAKCSQMQCGSRKKKKLDKTIKDELELLQLAGHDNVVRVFGWTQWTKSVAIIMEYLSGGNLMDLLDDSDVTVSMLLRLRMIVDVSSGLAFIHNLDERKRLVHGDIKAENILLSDTLRCKIADFGGAHISSYTGGSTITVGRRRDINQYSEVYASPEVLRNPTAVMKHTHDTYSFSMVVYVALGRKMPLAASNLKVYLEGVKTGQRPDLEQIKDMKNKLKEEDEEDSVRVMEVLMEVMQGCWKHDPLQRPTMIQVNERLKAFLDQLDEDQLLEDVEITLTDMEIEIPLHDQSSCVTIDRFLPPNFNDIKGPSHRATSESSADESLSISFSRVSVTSFSSLTSPEPAARQPSPPLVIPPQLSTDAKYFRQAQGFLRSIATLLEQNELNRAETECEQLVQIETKHFMGECDNLIYDIIKIADTLLKKWLFSCSLKLVEWCFGVCNNIEDLLDKLGKLDSCGGVIHAVSSSLNQINDKKEIKETALPLLWRIYDEIKLITSNYVQGKTDVVVKHLYYMGYCHLCVNDYEQADEMTTPGITLMTKNYGEKASKYCVLARCYDLIGRTSLCMGKYRTAAKHFQQAIEIYETAHDISDKERNEATATAEEWSKISRGVEWDIPPRKSEETVGL